MSWKKVSFAAPDIDLDPFTDLLNSLADFTRTLAEILKLILKITGALDDPIVALIKSVIDAIEKNIESFLEDLGAYVLHVPISKRLATDFLGLGDITPSWASELGIFGSEASVVPYTDPEIKDFLVSANRYNGGVYAFFSTFVDSLYDDGDTNRPMFIEEDDWIGGMTFITGVAFDPLGFLDDIWTTSRIFNGPDTTPKVPRPENLRIRTMEGKGNYFTAMLTWDLPDVPITTLTDLGSVVLWPVEFAVIRAKNNPRVLGASNIVDLMGKRDISEGDTFGLGNIEVIHQGQYNLGDTVYIDEKVPCSKDDTFYYAVAWKLKARYPSGNEEPINMDYWQISNVVRTIPYATIPASTPPDWYRTPAVADLIPGLAEFLRTMVNYLQSFSSRLVGGSTMLDNYVDFLEGEVAKYENMALEILESLQKIKSNIQMPKAGLWARTFMGKGGLDFLITDMAQSLTPSYPNAPPFHRGDEYVTGAIILAGGRKEDVAALVAALEALFGGSAYDEVAEMLDQLGEEVNELEKITFGPDLQEGTVETPPKKAFDDALVPTACTQEAPEKITFGKNMEPENDADA